MNANDHKSGYRIEKVYVADQTYKIVADPDRPRATPATDRNVLFGWDWRPVSPKRFEVVITVTVEPSSDTPEHVSVRLIGVFTAHEVSVSINFSEFLRVNAPAILFPFAREAISTMTGRGPFGAFHLNPINVPSLLSGVDISVSSGHRYLQEHPEFAATFGLLVEPGLAPAPAS